MQSEEKKRLRILVRGTNWIGDAVMSAPALECLREAFPDAHITLLAPPRTAELFDGASYLDEIVVYRRKEEGIRAFFAAVKMLRSRQFDLAVLFQNAFEAALLAWMSGARLRIGYDEQQRGWLLTHRLKRDDSNRNRHQVYDYLDIAWQCERAYSPLVEKIESRTPHPKFLSPERFPKLIASIKQKNAARAFLTRFGIDSERRPLVVLNAGATNSRAKCWPEDRFAQLANLLITATNAQIVLIGAASERDSAQVVINEIKQRDAKNLAGETTLAELVGLLDASELVVSNDTGPAHIAAALGRPTLTIFGPTNEFETAPSGINAEIIRADGIECARCMRRDCPVDHRCMTRISAEEVFARACRLMEENRCDM